MSEEKGFCIEGGVHNPITFDVKHKDCVVFG